MKSSWDGLELARESRLAQTSPSAAPDRQYSCDCEPSHPPEAALCLPDL